MTREKTTHPEKKTIWQRLTEPHPSIEDFAERRFASVLAILLLALVPLYFLPEGIRAIVERHPWANILYFVSGFVILTTSYFLARSRHPGWGAALTLLYFTVLPFAALITQADRYAGERASVALIWSLPIMLMALILVPPRDVKWVVFFQIGLYLIIPSLWDRLSYVQVFPTLWVVIAVGGLMIVSAFVQERYIRRAFFEAEQSKKAARELRKLSRATEQVASGVIITNTKGIIEFANPAALNITGYSEEEIIGNTPSMLKSGKHDAEFYNQLWETIKRGDTWRGELINRRKNGSLYWESQVISPVKGSTGEITHYVAVKEDITKAKENEEHIRNLSNATEQTASGIVITDAEGHIEYINAAFTNITGFTIDDIQGKTLEVQHSGKHPQSFYDNLDETMRYGEVWKGEIINLHKDGSEYWEAMTVSPIRNEAGEITHRVFVKEDITLRKGLEQALALAHEEALVASDMKTQLLANVSHDMRTPLGAILGYTEMLREGVFDPLTDGQDKAMRTISSSAQRLLDFVNNLLSQAQIDTGKLVLNQAPFSPEKLLTAMGGELSFAHSKGIDVETRICENLPAEIEGDAYWLGQILHNLVSNSIKFTPEGGKINITLCREDEAHWSLAVADTGKGIPPEAREYIFDSFRQVDGSAQREVHTGSGLGLSIVQDLVRLMNGTIKLDSELNKGSTFTVSLPLNQEKA